MPLTILTERGADTVYDDRDHPPTDARCLEMGWAKGPTWDRKKRQWKPKTRGPKIAVTAPEQPAGDSPPAAVRALPPEAGGADPDPHYLRGDEHQDQEHEHDRGPGGDEDRIPYDEVPQQVKDDIAGLAGLVGAPILAMLRSLDPYCGTALAENYEPIVDAALPLICRSSRIVRYFADEHADWLLWGKLAMALKPVGQAILQHHIFRTVEVHKDPATGVVTIVRVSESGPRDQGGDPLQPHVDPAQYAA